MHTIHYFAVEAESLAEAFDKVTKELSAEYGLATWSDWWVVGGGRWNSDPQNRYENADNDVIAYKHKPVDFMNTLEKVREWQVAEVKQLIDQIKSDEIATIVDQNLDLAYEFINNSDLSTTTESTVNRLDLSFKLFLLQHLQSLVFGSYSADSHFFDLTGETVNFNEVLNRIKTNPDQQYLVPVDFHY